MKKSWIHILLSMAVFVVILIVIIILSIPTHSEDSTISDRLDSAGSNLENGPPAPNGRHEGFINYPLKVDNNNAESNTNHSVNITIPDMESNISQSEYVDNLVKLFTGFPNISELEVAFRTLHAEIDKGKDGKSYQELFKLAYGVKQISDRLNNHKNQQSAKVKDTLEELKKTLPLIVRKMVWGEDACTIKNVYYDEYLYQANGTFERETGERSIFTWIPKGWNAKDPWLTEGSWKIIATENGTRFQITNEYWNISRVQAIQLVIDMTEDSEIKGLSNVVSSKDASRNSWHLEPVTMLSGKGVFSIKSDSGKQFVHAGDITTSYDNDRRNVFVSERTGTDVPSAAFWEIDCSFGIVTIEILAQNVNISFN